MNNVYKGIGIMSGTSLDGLDIAYCEYQQKNDEWFFSPGAATTVDYPKDVKEKLENIMEMNGLDLIAFDSYYGHWIGEQINKFIKKNNLSPDFIASHGHTVFHQPENNLTLQIGDGSAIHAKTEIPVIYNFRKLDVALGGQGAPLVPVGDALLFSKYKYCLNIGGIANISKTSKKKVEAYDICAANMVLNRLARRKDVDYDADGKIAAEGDLIEQLLKELDQLDFYQKDGPRSLGYEHVKKDIFPLLSEDYVVEDLLHTYSHHIAKKIGEAIKKHNGKEEHRMLVTGGGARNKFLIKLLKKYCHPVKIEVPAAQIVDYKEAIVFGFLGVLKIRGENNIWHQVTGSSKDSCSGVIAGNLQEK